MDASSAIYMPERRRIIVRGSVMGMGFRLWMRNVARCLSLVGSCNVLADGTVEAIVQGER